MLSEFASLEFIIDDSGSMMCQSDTIDPVTRRPNTRWAEAYQRLKEMIEIIGAFFPLLLRVLYMTLLCQLTMLTTRSALQPTSPFNRLALNS
jgi:hypothetical protein